LKYECQRYSNNSKPEFTDQEIMSLSLMIATKAYPLLTPFPLLPARDATEKGKLSESWPIRDSALPRESWIEEG